MKFYFMLLTKKTDFSDGVSMTNFIKRTWSRVKDHLLFLFSILRPCHSLLLCFQASVAEEKVYILGHIETISDGFWCRHEKLSSKVRTVVNLRNRTGEERRWKGLCDNLDNNFVFK